MQEYLIALIFAALPAISNLLGGLLAEALPYSRRALGLALHAATGVLLAIISVELIPRVIEAKPPWVIVLSFAAGGSFFVAIHHLLKLAKNRLRGIGSSAAPWVIFLSIAIDLFSDGLMIGTSVTITQRLGLILALARVIAHIPEGFATISEFKQQKVARRIRLPLLISFILPVLLGATLGYWVLRDRSELLKLAVLAFTTGTLTTAVVEEIIPEAHQTQDTNLSTLVFIASFAFFTLLSVYFE